MGAVAPTGWGALAWCASPGLRPLGAWAEQLLAESTGKDGRGILPVEGESLDGPALAGADRVFVATPDLPAPLGRAIAHAPAPSWLLDFPGPEALGAAFLRWEIATAAAGAVLQVDPFDEPNVSEAKQATRQVLDGYLERGHFDDPAPLASFGGLCVYAPPALAERIAPHVRLRDDPCAWARGLLELFSAGDYFAVLAYLTPTRERHELLQQLRLSVRDRHAVATTLGYGPRYLHSTGQLHKGGPDTGVFLQITSQKHEQPIPGERYGFKAVQRAQAAGDYLALERRGRRVMRVHLGGSVEDGLETLAEALRA
jgi:hypothetical protein